MQPYKNVSGHSGVAQYDTGLGFIRVRFHTSDKVYVYTDQSAGRPHIAEMQRLARNGQGLATYIHKTPADFTTELSDRHRKYAPSIFPENHDGG